MIAESKAKSMLNPEKISQRITSFEKRFGEAHLYLAYHAAFPLALTPDLTGEQTGNPRTSGRQSI
jgi:hypothetical protein